MRDLSECKAEIFLRSEKRIKKRKKQTRMLLSFIPIFVLSVSLVFVIKLSKFSNLPENDSGDNLGSLDGVSDGYTKLEIFNTGNEEAGEKKEIDYSKIQAVYSLLNSKFVSPDDNFTDEGLPGDGEAGLIIRFKTDSGKELVFVIKENELINTSKNKKIILKNDELSLLLSEIEQILEGGSL